MEQKEVQPVEKKNKVQILPALIIIAAIWYFFGGGLEKSALRTMDDIHKQVAEDAVSQYNIAKSSGGDKIDICVQAGLVSAAYLQAQDSLNYSKWKAIEKNDCLAAGLPR